MNEELPPTEEGENWLPLYYCPRFYSVSNRGRIWSHYYQRLLRPRVQKSGHLYITIRGGHGDQTVGVAACVLATFDRPPVGAEEACHAPDPDPANNIWPDNIRWGSRADNIGDMIASAIANNTMGWPVIDGYSRYEIGPGPDGRVYSKVKDRELKVRQHNESTVVDLLPDSGGKTNRLLVASLVCAAYGPHADVTGLLPEAVKR